MLRWHADGSLWVLSTRAELTLLSPFDLVWTVCVPGLPIGDRRCYSLIRCSFSDKRLLSGVKTAGKSAQEVGSPRL